MVATPAHPALNHGDAADSAAAPFRKLRRRVACRSGHRTVNLERTYWDYLAEISAREGYDGVDALVSDILQALPTVRQGSVAAALQSFTVNYYRRAETVRRDG